MKLPTPFGKVSVAGLLTCFFSLAMGEAQAPLPPPPKQFFNDYAGVTSPAKRQELNDKLAQLWKTTSNRVVVAVFAKMDSTLSLDDYTLKVANSWGVGERGKDNGVVLFVFIDDRKMRIQVGKGLTRTLTNELCQKIVDQDLKPSFRKSDFEGGLTAGVNSIIKSLNKPRATEHGGSK